jgi:curved DNA-binding protein CbpA
MKSAYSVLGIPGNARAEEIEQALQKAQAYYTRERLAEDPQAMAKLADIRDAHRILSNAEMRESYDRKLSTAVERPASRPRVVVVEASPMPAYAKLLIVMALLVVAMFAGGGYMSYNREQARKVVAAQELAQKKLEAEEAAKAQAQQEKAEAERARALARAESQERQLRAESSAIARNVAYANMQEQNTANRQFEAEKRDKLRRESDARNDERQRVYEAQRKLAADKQRIRELCYMQYRRSDC